MFYRYNLWQSVPNVYINGTIGGILFQMSDSLLSAKQATKPGPRANQRTEATRRSILDAAVKLYGEQGVEQTTISAIIAASGVGRTTFYRHFEDQDDVLNQALQRDFESLLADFEAQRHEHDSLEAQIVDDMIFFARQLSNRPALALLFEGDKNQFYQRVHDTLESFRDAGLAFAKPTFERAQREGRLREGMTLQGYVDWTTFVVTSLQVVDTPFAADEIRLRDMMVNYLVPSLVGERKE